MIEKIKDILFEKYEAGFEQCGITSPREIPNDFDIIQDGIVDSLGFLTFVIGLEEENNLQLDLSQGSIETLTTVRNIAISLQGAMGQRTVVHYADVVQALADVGIERGDTLVIHSGLQYIGAIEGGLDTFYRALVAAVGPSGTLVTPCANIPAYKGGGFDRFESPAQESIGVLCEFIRTQPKAVRSGNPLDSVCAVGANAHHIADIDNPTAYGVDSPWYRAMQCDGKILLIGVDLAYASVIHCVERECSVPYRTWQNVHGYVLSKDGKNPAKYSLYSRTPQTKYNFAKLHQVSPVDSLFKSASLGYGRIMASGLKDLYAVAVEAVKRDANFFLTNKDETHVG